MSNFESLTAVQQEAYRSYQEMMGAGNFQMTVQLLESAGWDVHTALAIQFGGAQVLRRPPVVEEHFPVIPLDDELASFPPESSSHHVASQYGYPSNTSPLSNTMYVTNFQDRHLSANENIKLPELFIGNLVEAIEYAYIVKERPLLFYIDHQESECSHSFAQNILSNDLVRQIINNRFTLFLWDITETRGRKKLISDLDAACMPSVRAKFETIKDCTHAFPILMAVSRENNFATVLEYCESTDRVEQVSEKLMAGAELYDVMKEAKKKRDSVQSEQEQEYHRASEEDRLRREELLRREQEEQRQLDEARESEVEDAVRQENMRNAMPDEPEQTDDTIVTVRFTFPNVLQKIRRFRKTESLQTLIDFLASNGWSTEEYNFISSDRRNICDTFDLTKTFEGAIRDREWTARESVIVVKKNIE